MPGQRSINSSFTGSDEQATRSAVEPAFVGTVRSLALEGQLARTAASATPRERVALSGATFVIAWPVVFNRLTRSIELRRGHSECAESLLRMRPDCVDRFYDDVEAVIDDVLSHASVSIRDLDAWIAARLTAATVDGHRRRRGNVGALQRPRMPKWLADQLGHDVWLVDLGLQVLVWVGIDVTAGYELWPLDSWAARRAMVTGDPSGSDAATVARDVERVLDAMRTRPTWFENYVERPLGHKRIPVAGARGALEDEPLVFTERTDIDDTHLVALAAVALREIERGLAEGRDPRTVVTEVVGKAFADGTAREDLDYPPLHGPDYEIQANAALGNPAAVDRIVAAVLAIIA